MILAVKCYRLGGNIFKLCKMSAETLASNAWRGVSMYEIYGSESPWGCPEFPLVSPNHAHTVLYHIPSTGLDVNDRLPKPQVGSDIWDHNYVRLPCSDKSLYPVQTRDGSKLVKRWDIIKESLHKPIRNSKELADAILAYNSQFKSVWKFRALHTLFESYLEEEESDHFFKVTLPQIVKLALSLPDLIKTSIPLLQQGKEHSISISQQQVACLLANAFFCTFPRRNSSKRTSEYASYPRINFNSLYESNNSDAVLEKLKCLCHYFRRVCNTMPPGVVTYTRRVATSVPNWRASETPISSTLLHIDSNGKIEDEGVGLIQVDFANKYLGGGVLNYGSVQEEIRFVICPELMLSMLFCEVLAPKEAVLMLGCERYSLYTGYSDSFKFNGDVRDVTPRDSSLRRRVAVLALDAAPIRTPRDEWRLVNLVRELNKAWSGMSVLCNAEESAVRRPGLATGNWGCGAFGGTPRLKFLLQLMAATEARRPLVYYTFGDVDLMNNLDNIYNLLCKYNVTVGQLYKMIVEFSESKVQRNKLYEYIHQALLDGAKPPAQESCNAMEVSLPSDIEDAFNSEMEAPRTPSTKNSPDMFSQSSDTPELQCDPSETIAKQATQSNDSLTTQSVSQTNRLFDEIDRIETENSSKCNRQSQIGTGKDILNKTSDELLASNASPDVKKVTAKKITDYFTKKT